MLHTRLVSANYFQVLRVPMAMGRTLTPDDTSDAAVISHELWQRRFRTDPDIVGRSIVLDSVTNALETEDVTVIGVAAEEFNGTEPHAQCTCGVRCRTHVGHHRGQRRR